MPKATQVTDTGHQQLYTVIESKFQSTADGNKFDGVTVGGSEGTYIGYRASSSIGSVIVAEKYYVTVGLRSGNGWSIYKIV